MLDSVCVCEREREKERESVDARLAATRAPCADLAPHARPRPPPFARKHRQLVRIKPRACVLCWEVVVGVLIVGGRFRAQPPDSRSLPARIRWAVVRAETISGVWGYGRVLSVDGGSGGRGLVIIPRTPIAVWVPQPPENSDSRASGTASLRQESGGGKRLGWGWHGLVLIIPQPVREFGLPTRMQTPVGPLC